MRPPVLPLLLLSCAFLASAGCGVHRGLPSHGGGKRFDEEQRAVTGAIRAAVADMRLDGVSGKAVRLVMDGVVAHNGGGDAFLPGIETVNLSASIGTSQQQTEAGDFKSSGARNGSDDWEPDWTQRNRGANAGASANAPLRLTSRLQPHAFGTDADANYLRAALLLRLHHQGARVVQEKPDLILHVLVDVLGTNLSRTDLLLAMRDDLAASCELTYYLADPDQAVSAPARRCGGRASYSETGLILISGLDRERHAEAMPAAELPADHWPDPPPRPAVPPAVPPPAQP